MNSLNLTDKQLNRYWSKVDIKDEDECWEWKASKSNFGYGKISINGKDYLSHRVSYCLTYGDIPKDNSSKGTLFVCHTCDNKGCCNPSHLFLGTTQDNMDDMKLKKRSPHTFGEINGCHKLTEKQIIEIRQKYSTGLYFQRVLAEEFGVRISAISRIVNHKRWKHI